MSVTLTKVKGTCSERERTIWRASVTTLMRPRGRVVGLLFRTAQERDLCAKTFKGNDPHDLKMSFKYYGIMQHCLVNENGLIDTDALAKHVVNNRYALFYSRKDWRVYEGYVTGARMADRDYLRQAAAVSGNGEA